MTLLSAFLSILAIWLCLISAITLPSSYDEVWTTQSINSAGSMPVGGGDIGLNVWVENNTVLFYIAKSGTFDENNSMLKLGRVRLELDPNPFAQNASFEQRLNLNDGNIEIKASNSCYVNIWVDVHHPVIHVELNHTSPVSMKATYEGWRSEDYPIPFNFTGMASWVGDGVWPFIQTRDAVEFHEGGVRAVHANSHTNMTRFQLAQQNLTQFADTLYNPRDGNIFGMYMHSEKLFPGGIGSGHYINTSFKSWDLTSAQPSTNFSLTIALAQQQSDIGAFYETLESNHKQYRENTQEESMKWWHDFWDISYIIINEGAGPSDPGFQVGKNYQIWRYMMGCNFFGDWPTRFNGGLFTFDPVLVNPHFTWTPDFRLWTGGTFTAQNQRMVYWGLLRSGDFEMMKSQFDFYRRITPTCQLRAKYYEDIEAASFLEQIDNTGLPCVKGYETFRGPNNTIPNLQGFAYRPPAFPGFSDDQPYTEFVIDTANEFADMILQAHLYTGQDISSYMEFIESQIVFYDRYYQKAQRNRDWNGLTGVYGNESLVLYPTSGQETYKGAYNSASTIAGIRKVLTDLLAIAPEFQLNNRSYYEGFLQRVPATPLRLQQGYTCIAPAEQYVRIQNIEVPQLYPLWPWGEFGLGAPNLSLAMNTYLYDLETQGFYQNIGWQQWPVWTARLGLENVTTNLTANRFSDSVDYRFSAFKGPYWDWTPDINHYGTSAIAMQEQLIQTWYNNTIRLLPAWPSAWNVEFRLYAPEKTTVQGKVVNGNFTSLDIEPKSRMADVVYRHDNLPPDPQVQLLTTGTYNLVDGSVRVGG